jgi:hypothetical protein
MVTAGQRERESQRGIFVFKVNDGNRRRHVKTQCAARKEADNTEAVQPDYLVT